MAVKTLEFLAGKELHTWLLDAEEPLAHTCTPVPAGQEVTAASVHVYMRKES